MTRSLATLALALGFAPSTAFACGGFFCASVPMDQSKERIVFAVDEDEQKVDVHVQIFYEGAAHKFAWVVPVPAVPDIKLSSDAMFQRLSQATQPQFWLQWEERGTCTYDGGWGLYPEAAEDDFDGNTADTAGAPGGGVTVEAAGQTGPFDWKVVSATSEEALIAWLGDPDGDPQTDDAYDVPPAISSKLGTYLSGGSKFVAFKLTSDSDTGDILPIRMSYDGDTASIPLILTSIAATPDMRLEPYIFANQRAVPSNYLHVQINEAKINWLTGGRNYDDVITLAADEAGGQAFATDYYGSTSMLRGTLYAEGQFDLDRLRDDIGVADIVDELSWQGFPRNAAVLAILRDHLPMPAALVQQGLADTQFYNCLSCYSQYLPTEFDFDAFVDDLEERIVQPLVDAEDMFTTYSKVTRMTSSVSPQEMTLDPMFVLNPDMSTEVPNTHQATLVIDCGDGGLWSAAQRWIELADGRIIQVPSDAWFQANGQSYDDWSTGDEQPAAEVIERTGATGQPEPIADNGPAIDDLLAEYNEEVLKSEGRDVGAGTLGAGCAGCAQTGGSLPAGGLFVGLLALAGLRRRD